MKINLKIYKQINQNNVGKSQKFRSIDKQNPNSKLKKPIAVPKWMNEEL